MTELFRTVLNMSITGVYIAAAIIILRLFMKKLPKKYSYMLWAILGIRLLCPFSFSSAVSLFNVLVPEKPEISSGQMEYIPSDIEYSYEPKVTVSVPPVNETVNTYLPPAEPNNSANPMQIVMSISAIVWLVGMAAMVIYTVLSYISVRKRVKGAKEQNDIFICDNIETPFVFGIIKPRIYLPENVSEEDMRYIIAHEQTHIRRGDHIVKLIAMAALCVHWFDPMVWISYRLMTKDMELSCDEKALGTFDADVKKAYANALLNISLKQNKLALGGVLSFGESDIKSRIKGVLGAKKPKVIVTIIAVIAVIIAAVCLLTNAVKKTTEFAPIPDGVYVTDKLLYTSPYKDSYWGDDNGLTYEIKGDTITISGKTYKLSEPMEIPYTDAEWDEAFWDADTGEGVSWHGGRKMLSDYTEKYCFALESNYDGGYELYLFVMDDELWYVTYGWEIYRLKLSEDNLTEDIQEDIPEDVSDDDVTDEPAYSLPANEVPPLQTSDEYESEDFGELKKVSYKTEEFIPDKNGGFSFSADRKLLNIEFFVPSDWMYKAGDFENQNWFVMGQQVAYPDSYGIVTDDFKVDQVSGREVKIIDEKYGDENDPWSYYIHTIIADSYYGDFDYHHFVVHSGEYYVEFSFNNSEDFNMAIAESVLESVSISYVGTPVIPEYDTNSDEAFSAEFSLCASYLTEYINASFGMGDFNARKYTNSKSFAEYVDSKYTYERNLRTDDTLTKLIIHDDDIESGIKSNGTKWLAFNYEVSFIYAMSSEESGYGRMAYFEYSEEENGNINIISVVDFGPFDARYIGLQETMGEPPYEVDFSTAIVDVS